MVVRFLKLIFSIRGTHCGYSPRAPKKLSNYTAETHPLLYLGCERRSGQNVKLYQFQNSLSIMSHSQPRSLRAVYKLCVLFAGQHRNISRHSIYFE